MGESQIRRVIFATEPDGSFGSGPKTWVTPDLSTIMRLVRDSGYAAEAVRIDRLLDFERRDSDLLVYTSAFSPALRQYVRDVIYFAAKDARVTPEYDLLLAHENKGVQELIKARRALGNLPGDYHVDFDERTARPPYVFKSATGAGSSGVALVRNHADEERIRKRYFLPDLKRRLKLLQRRFALTSDQFRRYAYYYKRFMPYVTQPFVEGLAGDVKVLVFGERYYTLARSNRPGDFRASGSGRFDFDEPCPPAILDFARDVAKRFDTPFISLDVAQSGSGCHLLEFQALNFGPLTLTGSNGYYVNAGGQWQRVAAPGDLDDAFAHAIVHYLGSAGGKPKGTSRAPRASRAGRGSLEKDSASAP